MWIEDLLEMTKRENISVPHEGSPKLWRRLRNHVKSRETRRSIP